MIYCTKKNSKSQVNFINDYHKLGFKLIPIKPLEKIPKVKEWSDRKDKSNFIKDGDNVAVITGSVSGITVIDFDKKEIGEKFISLFGLEKTYKVNTPRGVHLYFKYTPKLKQTQGVYGICDIRNDGGYVLVPPSKVKQKDGSIKGYSTHWGELVEIPEELLNCLNLFYRSNNFLKNKLDIIPEGSRNTTLTSLAGSIINLDNLNINEKQKLLHFINIIFCEPPLNEKEVNTIFNSIKRKGNTTLTEETYKPKTRKEKQKKQIISIVLDWLEKTNLTDRLIYSPDVGAFLKYDELKDYWCIDEKEININHEIWEFIKKRADVFRGSNGDYENIKKMLTTIKEFSIYGLSEIPKGLACKNCVINLKTKEYKLINSYRGKPYLFKVEHNFFQKEDPQYKLKFNGSDWIPLDVEGYISEVNEGIKDTKFYQFLRDCIEGGEEILFLQKAVGSTLDEDKKDVNIYFLHGEPGSGKSTFIKIIEGVLMERVSTLTNEFLKSNTQVNREYYKAQLVGKNIIYTEELTAKEALESALMKEIFSGNKIQARHPGGKPFTFKPNFSLFILTNILPDLTETTGMERRVKVIEFKKGYERPNYRLAEEITETEGEFIFNWIVAGYFMAMKDYEIYGDLYETEKMEADKVEWFREIDPFEEWFETYLIKDPESWIKSEDLYKHYKTLYPNAREKLQTFREKLNYKGIKSVVKWDTGKGKSIRVLVGIRLTENLFDEFSNINQKG